MLGPLTNLPFCKHYCLCFPALNVDHHHEAVATDMIYSNMPAIDDVQHVYKFFIGQDTLVTDVYGMKFDSS